MTFAFPVLLTLLLLLPLVILLLRASARRRTDRARAFADEHLHTAVLHSGSPWHTRAPLVLQLAALTLLLLSAAHPTARPHLPVNQAAVMIALDASRSMLADDTKPNRLEAAKSVARTFVEQAPRSTRIGLLTFSEGASVLTPPTADREELLAAIDRVEPASATSFASALVTGVRALPGRRNATPPPELDDAPTGVPPAAPREPLDPSTLAPSAILLLSDGISNRGANPLIAARFASDHLVTLHAVAIGREGGAVTQVEGQLVFVPFDTRELERLTQLTGGRFLHNANETQLQDLSRELGTVIRWEPSSLALAGPLAGIAALLLIVGGGLALLWQRRVP